MTIKQQLMNMIQTWMKEELVEGKLKLILENPALVDVEFEQITLVDIHMKVVSTSGYSKDYNEYMVLTAMIKLDKEMVELSVCEGDEFEGVYVLEDYDIMYESGVGTELHLKNVWNIQLQEEDKTKEPHVLEDVFNGAKFADWVYHEILESDLFSDFMTELGDEHLISTDQANALFDEVTKVESEGLDKNKFTFASGFSIVVENEVLKNIRFVRK